MLYQRIVGIKATRVAVAIVTLAVATGGAIRAAQPQKSSVAPSRIKVPSGERLLLELQTPINTTTAREGDRVVFTLVREIEKGGKTALPKGTSFAATVKNVKSARTSKQPEIEFRLDSVDLPDGTKIPLSASNITAKSDRMDSFGSSKGSTVQGLQSGMGQALQGAMLGAMLAGRKGALTGAAAAASIDALGRKTGGGGGNRPAQEMNLGSGQIFETKLSRTIEVPERSTNTPTLTATANAPSVLSEPERGPIFENIGGRRESKPAEAENEVIELTAEAVDEGPRAPAPVIVTQPSADDLIAPRPAVSSSAIDASPLPDQPEELTLSVNVRLAQIDTLVRDMYDRPIDNLKIQDFRLFEDSIERPVKSLSRDETPLAVAFVVDRSASVEPFLDKVQGAAYKALSQLKRGDTACLFAFANTVELREDLTTDFQRIANSIGSIGLKDGTAINDAIYQAFTYLERNAPNKKRAVILISDNEQETDRRQHSIDEIVQLAQRTETVLYSIKMDGGGAGGGSFIPLLIPTIPMPRRRAEHPVPGLVLPTGGEIFEVRANDASGIERALATAIGRLKLRYTVGYSPTGNEGTFHSIEVRLAEVFGKAGYDYTVLARSGTYDTVSSAKKR